MPLSFAWWNTALSPTKKRGRASASEQSIAARVVGALTCQAQVDLVALGEVAEEDIKAIRSVLGEHLQDYLFIPSWTKAGRSSFDTCVFYKKDTIEVTHVRDITRVQDGNCLRVAQHFTVEHVYGSKPLHFFISHWPSQLRGDAHEARVDAAVRLRGVVDEALEADPTANLILLGDYNDEPYGESVMHRLHSSRERSLVQSKSSLLYNPCWPFMGGGTNSKGTCFYASDKRSRWKAYDQVMLSSSLVTGAGGWNAKEPCAEVLANEYLYSIVEDPSLCFDHLPVLGKLEGAHS